MPKRAVYLPVDLDNALERELIRRRRLDGGDHSRGGLLREGAEKLVREAEAAARAKG